MAFERTIPPIRRPRLEDLPLSPGKKARLYRLMYRYGPGKGTLLILPIDQGLEHGPVDFFPNPAAADPDFQFRLALEGNYSAIACHIGLATRYYPRYAGRVPLVLKINGKTNIPSDAHAFSALTASVEDAVRLGADAVGYTLYVGSPAQDRDFEQLTRVRQDCDRYGMPLIVWSYPRGEAIEKKGGRDSLYAVDYAARLAHELGADVIKLNVPKLDDRNRESPAPYNEIYREADYLTAVRKVVASAANSFVIFSGGSKLGDEDLLEKARLVMRGGAVGLIFGRNMWQRPFEEALEITRRVSQILVEEIEG